MADMINTASTSRFEEILASRGISRRGFLQLCASIAAASGAAALSVPRVAEALEASVIGAVDGHLFPVIWMEGASCTGCTETFTQLEDPNIETIVLDMISLTYSDTLSAGAGYSLEEAKDQTIANGNYVLIYEGAVGTAFDGWVLRIAGKTGTELLKEAASNAQAIVAAGSCAVNGGWMAAEPNVTGAMGVQQFLQQEGIDTPVVNIPSCPANNEWVLSVLVDVVVMKDMELLKKRLNQFNEPGDIFNQTIHENCQRRGHFEAGEFVYEPGSIEEKLGYCLYALGCRGPLTRSICGITQYNNHTSWCVNSGGPCIGCCEADPLNTHDNWVQVNTPFLKRDRTLRIGGWYTDPTTIGLIVTGAIAAVLVVHGFGMKAAKRTPGGPEIEKVRVWDAKHPNEAIGVYDEADLEAAEAKYHTRKED